MDKYGALLILLLILVCYLSFFRGVYNNTTVESEEGMAPIGANTFVNHYPRGRCIKGSFERSACSVGNCPIGTTVTDQRYCGIMCAQEVDAEDRKNCNKECMEMVKNCH